MWCHTLWIEESNAAFTGTSWHEDRQLWKIPHQLTLMLLPFGYATPRRFAKDTTSERSAAW